MRVGPKCAIFGRDDHIREPRINVVSTKPQDSEQQWLGIASASVGVEMVISRTIRRVEMPPKREGDWLAA